MKATYYQRGETLDYIPDEDVEAGQVVDLETRIGVAAEDAAAGQLGHVHVVGVFVMTKASGEITQGADVYYDSDAEAITTEEGENTPAGYAAASAAADDDTVLVKLLG